MAQFIKVQRKDGAVDYTNTDHIIRMRVEGGKPDPKTTRVLLNVTNSEALVAYDGQEAEEFLIQFNQLEGKSGA